MMDSNMNATERTVLLGLIPLLGASGQLSVGLAALVACVLIGLSARLLNRATVARISDAMRWPLLFAVGLAVAFVVFALAGFVLPVSERILPYVLISGVSPICYYGCAQQVSAKELGAVLGRFAALMLAFGVIREPLGRGTIAGFEVLGGGDVPMSLLSSAPGAFLLTGAVLVLFRALHAGPSLQAER